MTRKLATLTTSTRESKCSIWNPTRGVFRSPLEKLADNVEKSTLAPSVAALPFVQSTAIDHDHTTSPLVRCHPTPVCNKPKPHAHAYLLGLTCLASTSVDLLATLNRASPRCHHIHIHIPSTIEPPQYSQLNSRWTTLQGSTLYAVYLEPCIMSPLGGTSALQMA